MGTLPCWTSFGKTSMKPSSIDDPVARYSPRTGSRQKASNVETATRPRSDQRRRPPLTNGIDTAGSVGAEASSTGGVARSVKRRDGSQCNAGAGVYRRPDVPRRVGVERRRPSAARPPVVRRRPDRSWCPPGPHARVARSGRSRRRGVGGARRRVHASLGRCGSGGAASDVVGHRPTGDGATQRVRRRPTRQPIFGLPEDDRRRTDPPDGSLRRTRRDLERRAVVLAGVVSSTAHHVPAPRARPDVGPDPPRPPGIDRPRSREPRGAAVLPPDATR